LGILFLAFLGSCAFFWSQQRQLIFAPKEFEEKDETSRYKFKREPKEIPLPAGCIARCTHLPAFWVEATDPNAPVFLYLHGRDATRNKNLHQIENLHKCGYHVLSFDYRGFAETYGDETPSEGKVYEDALAALDYLLNNKGIPANRIFIYGHSLGGAVAIDLATRDQAKGTAGLIVESSFTSISDMTPYRFGGLLMLLPIDLLLTERFDSIRKIGGVKPPTLVIHGKNDAKVPFEMGKALHKEIENQGGLFCEIPNGDHADCCTASPEIYRDSLISFVSNCLTNGSK
jgi:pimeloyl-ACP methyl ester carboxylesterase